MSAGWRTFRHTELRSGVMGVAAISSRAGVSTPTVLRWQRMGRLPKPDFATGSGAVTLALNDGPKLAQHV